MDKLKNALSKSPKKPKESGKKSKAEPPLPASGSKGKASGKEPQVPAAPAGSRNASQVDDAECDFIKGKGKTKSYPSSMSEFESDTESFKAKQAKDEVNKTLVGPCHNKAKINEELNKNPKYAGLTKEQQQQIMDNQDAEYKGGKDKEFEARRVSNDSQPHVSVRHCF